MKTNDNETPFEQDMQALAHAALSLTAPYILAHRMQTDPAFAKRMREAKGQAKP